MAQTVVPFGSVLAKKVFGAAVFSELVQSPGFSNSLTGPAPQLSEATSRLSKMQTSPKFPFVRITDLSVGAGLSVSVDHFNVLQGLPTMGDEPITGRMASLSYSSMDIKINQTRFGVDTGGRMSQQATEHNLRTVGRAGVVGWWARWNDQTTLVHLGGARGQQNDPSWVIPLSSHAEFAKIMVNDVSPPTKNRHFFAGGKTDLESLTTTDIITLDDLDRIQAVLEESIIQFPPVVLPGMPEEDGFWCIYLSPRQWHYFKNRTTGIRAFQRDAGVRGENNPLFRGDVGRWGKFVIKQLPRAIRFAAGTTTTVTTNDTTLATGSKTVPAFGGAAGAGIDRAIILGAQALGFAFGRHSASDTHMAWHEELTNHGNNYEASVSAVVGKKKFRFVSVEGEWVDHGVAVLDSYAPDPRSVTIS